MISFIVMAALSTAPEMNANVFKRQHKHHAPAACPTCDAPAPCTGCGAAPTPCGDAPCAGGAAPGTVPATPATPAEPAKSMPKGDAPKTDMAPKADAPKGDMPKGDKVEAKVAPVPEKKAEAPIEIPANLKEAIGKSDQKQQIMDYLNNTTVPREQRIQYLETVRQTLLVDPTKK